MRSAESIKRLLESPLWIQELPSGEAQSRVHDDCDGKKEGELIVTFTPDGDAWVWTDKHFPGMRFRNFGGGGRNLRTRNALVILAYAMMLDEKETEQREMAVHHDGTEVGR